jgi:N-hydroxyarylamine O-acetyltransferase
MDADLYLKRINYDGELGPALESLSALQQAHLLSVPFENLDIHNKIEIDLPHSYEKIAVRKRGGFCYELNSTFYRLLENLGYRVKMVSARVFDDEKNDYGPEFDHMAIVAAIHNDNYLVDVGFGEFAFHPLKIDLDTEFHDPRGIFRFGSFENSYLLVEKKAPGGDFVPQYIFSEKERRLEEFYDMCRFHQTSPESHFTQKRICSLPTHDGRVSLTGNTLKITANGKITERQLANESEVQKVLWDYFGIG